ncbi:hypothetical protein ACFE04_012620 [Oxalis oulophora]
MKSPSPKLPPPIKVESIKCASCGFTEDCTPAYILRIRNRYNGRWICGLCVEAVKDEVVRSGMCISTEEALNRHIRFCNETRAEPSDTPEHPIFVMGRIMRRILDSTPRRRTGFRSNSSVSLSDAIDGPTKPLARSGSCFPSLSSQQPDLEFSN